MIIARDATSSPLLRALCGSPPSFTFTKKVPSIEVTIPIAPNKRGKKTGDNPFNSSWKLSEPATMAAPRIIVPIIDPT